MPPGDPGAMRAYATLLRGDATHLRSIATTVDSTSHGMPFTAPVAERVRHSVTADATTLKGLADRLDAVARLFENSAGTVEDDQAAWHAERLRLLAENKAQ